VLADAAVRAIVEHLDPHSTYLTSEELRWFEEDVRGSYGGVGFEVVPDGDVWRVVGVVPDGPAAKGGVRAGDRILRVASMIPGRTERLRLLKALRGPVGGSVALLVASPSAPEREVVLDRAVVVAQSVMLAAPIVDDEGRAILRVRQFQETTIAALDDAIATLAREANLRGIVLDLRGNPGGLVDVARHAADQWIVSGPIHGMALRGREYREVLASESAPLLHVPTVVLVDAGTASAAELLAAALRERVGATIVGERTFGKGTVQIVEKLRGGGAIDLTIGEYRTACGASIQATGLVPDITVVTSASSERPVLREEDMPRVLLLDAPRQRPIVPRVVTVPKARDGVAQGSSDVLLETAKRELASVIASEKSSTQRGCRP
jgi:carboxyl-terminal processing protease